jgi:hypothetical protein
MGAAMLAGGSKTSALFCDKWEGKFLAMVKGWLTTVMPDGVGMADA